MSSVADLLPPGFETRHIASDGATIAVRLGGRRAGEAPALLLLHGYPQTHAMWHRVVPALAPWFHLILADLRGYGDSTGPSAAIGAPGYTKRAMAADMVAVLDALGLERAHLAGHDRGGRVAYRLALDHPQRVDRLAVLDILPTAEVWARITHERALGFYHWMYLAAPAPVPERMIGADPDFYLDHLLARWAGAPLDPVAVAAYRQAFRRPDVIAATCNDYRAGASLDVDHDLADRAAGRRIAAPTCVIWGEQFLKTDAGSGGPLAIWRDWCAQAPQGVALDCGHFVAEEAPGPVAEALLRFFTAHPDSRP